MINAIERPPIGFIVEGHGEHNCYPSLVRRILNVSGLHFPIENAQGTGNIVRHLHEQLDDIVLTHHPYYIIISTDLRDNIGQSFTDCAQLRTDLIRQVEVWLQISSTNARLNPLPNRVEVIIQIQQFETWILSDINNLSATGYFAINNSQFNFIDIDAQISNPAQLLQQCNNCGRKLKDPRFAKDIITRLNPNIMRQNSKSFDKFFREVQKSYQNWCHSCGI